MFDLYTVFHKIFSTKGTSSYKTLPTATVVHSRMNSGQLGKQYIAFRKRWRMRIYQISFALLTLTLHFESINVFILINFILFILY
jgi:hypothetical protein